MATKQIKTWVANTWVKLLQTTGQSTNKAMSQKAVTDSLDSLKSDLVAKANMLSYEEIMATTPPINLDDGIPKASALKELGGTDWLQISNKIRCKKIGNVKFIQAKAITGTKATWTQIGILPEEYRPINHVLFSFSTTNSLNIIATGMITTDGIIQEYCNDSDIVEAAHYNINFMYM